MSYQMRKPCSECGCAFGVIRTVGFQDTVRCHQCGKFQYNAPRQETGKPQMHVPTREAVKLATRTIVLLRANGACEVCHNRDVPLSVGHLLSLDAGRAQGMTDEELNHEENLAAMCDACNLGIGRNPVPMRLMMAMLNARMKNARSIGRGDK